MNEIKQFKLVSGDEIICEVLEWPTDDFSGLVVRRVLQLRTTFDKNGNRYYTFRPWMALQEGGDMFISLDGNHLVGEANPDLIMVKNYKEAVDNNELSEEELIEKVGEYVEKLKEMRDGMELYHDSDSPNVLSFPNPRNKMH
jgi:hypothetical protein|tara:strand:+ start:90 stop:515 length:426 start_codon:yes stop_codon:yes gene_type:complete